MRTKLITLMVAIPALAGCSAISSTTNSAAKTLNLTLDGTTNSIGSSTGGDNASSYAKAKQFVDSQYAMIRREAAAGGGVHTAALARLMGASDVEAFNTWLQSNYATLFDDRSKQAELVPRITARRDQIALKQPQTGT